MWALPGAQNDPESIDSKNNRSPALRPFSQALSKGRNASTAPLQSVPAQALAYALASLIRTSLSAFTACIADYTTAPKRDRRFQRNELGSTKLPSRVPRSG